MLRLLLLLISSLNFAGEPGPNAKRMWTPAPKTVVKADPCRLSEQQLSDLKYWEDRAEFHLVQNDWQESFQSLFNALHECIDNCPDQVRLFTKLGHLYLHFNKGKGDAEGYYRKALYIDPYYTSALMGLGDVYFQRKEYKEAKSIYERARDLDLSKFQPHASIAACYYELALPEDAINNYEKALAMNPNDVVSINNEGNIFYDRKQMDLAEEYYKRAIEIAPEFGVAHNNLGNVYLHNKDLRLAKKHFQKSLSIFYEDSGVHSNLANVYFEWRQVERAKWHLHKALEYEDHEVYHNNLAVMEMFTGETNEAGVHYAKALAKNKSYSNARKNGKFFRERSQKMLEASYTKRFYLLKPLDKKVQASTKRFAIDEGRPKGFIPALR